MEVQVSQTCIVTLCKFQCLCFAALKYKQRTYYTRAIENLSSFMFSTDIIMGNVL